MPSGSDSFEATPSQPRREPPAAPGRSVDRPAAVDPEVAQLTVRLQAGDPAALGDLFDRFGTRCYALARRLLGEQSLAEDAVQEAFLAFWRTPERFDATKGSLATFLLTLTHRRAIDVLRREALQRRGRVASDEGLVQMPSVEAGTDEQAEAHLEGAAVRRALEELPDVQRQALQLAYYQGYTQREIASITGAPLGTVKTRMLAGVRTLRTKLGPQFDTQNEPLGGLG